MVLKVHLSRRGTKAVMIAGARGLSHLVGGGVLGGGGRPLWGSPPPPPPSKECEEFRRHQYGRFHNLYGRVVLGLYTPVLIFLI
jgi:hypothetical protein